MADSGRAAAADAETLGAKPRRRSGPKSKSSPYVGVTQYKRTGHWEAHIWVQNPRGKGHQRHLGSYPTAEEAARCYDRAVLKLRGEAAETNFGREEYEEDAFMLQHTRTQPGPFLDQLRAKFALPSKPAAGRRSRTGAGRAAAAAAGSEGEEEEEAPSSPRTRTVVRAPPSVQRVTVHPSLHSPAGRGKGLVRQPSLACSEDDLLITTAALPGSSGQDPLLWPGGSTGASPCASPLALPPPSQQRCPEQPPPAKRQRTAVEGHSVAGGALASLLLPPALPAGHAVPGGGYGPGLPFLPSFSFQQQAPQLQLQSAAAAAAASLGAAALPPPFAPSPSGGSLAGSSSGQLDPRRGALLPASPPRHDFLLPDWMLGALADPRSAFAFLPPSQ